MKLWLRRNLDQRAALPMFVAALLFLFILTAWLQCLPPEARYHDWTTVLAVAMVALYPLFLLEPLLHWAIGSRRWKQGLVYWLVPPLRMIGRDHRSGRAVWMPFVGWTRASRGLHKKVERNFSAPMIFVALMVLPLLAFEYRWQDVTQEQWYPRFLSQTAASFIWLAFTIEFIVMIAIVDKKTKYCREHWIDLAIILLPLVHFVRVLRLGLLLRLNQVGRVYRLRGLALRLLRALLMLDILGRVLRISPEKKIAQLKELLTERQHEIDDLRQQIEKLETAIDAGDDRQIATIEADEC